MTTCKNSTVFQNLRQDKNPSPFRSVEHWKGLRVRVLKVLHGFLLLFYIFGVDGSGDGPCLVGDVRCISSDFFLLSFLHFCHFYYSQKSNGIKLELCAMQYNAERMNIYKSLRKNALLKL